MSVRDWNKTEKEKILLKKLRKLMEDIFPDGRIMGAGEIYEGGEIKLCIDVIDISKEQFNRMRDLSGMDFSFHENITSIEIQVTTTKKYVDDMDEKRLKSKHDYVTS